MTSTAATLPSKRSLLFTLVYTEACMCFVRFSMMSLFVLYLVKVQHWSDQKAYALYGLFISLLFTTPIFLGVVVDRYLGYRRSILMGGVLLALGTLGLLFPQVPYYLYWSLGLMVLGSGLFHPSLAPILHQLYEHSERNRENGFIYDYLGQNIGAIVGPVVCGSIAQRYGFEWAFGICALGLVSGLFVFSRQRMHFPDSVAQYKPIIWPQLMAGLLGLATLFSMLLYYAQWGKATLILAALGLLVTLIQLLSHQQKEQRHFGVGLLVVLLVLMAFETFLNQGGLTFSLFIERHVDRMWGSFEIPTSMFYALASTFMMVWGVWIVRLWTRLEQRKQMPGYMSRFVAGMLGMAASLMLLAAGARMAGLSTGHCSMLFVVAAYALLPLAELCLVPVSLAWLTQHAPSERSSFFVGLWMLSKALGGLFAGEIAQWAKVEPHWNLYQSVSVYQTFFSALSISAIIITVVLIVMRNFEKKIV